MILHQSASVVHANYDRTYGANEEHFTQRTAVDALETVFERYIRDGVRTAIDVGCGQGRLVEATFEAASRFADVSPSDFFGLDGSNVAIQQADKRSPQHGWIHDRFEEFLKVKDSIEAIRDRTFDLVTVKSGLTFIKDQDDYRQAMEGIKSMLRDGGYYFYLINKQFYLKWQSNHDEWTRDLIEVTQDVFGREVRVENQSYLYLLFRKGGFAEELCRPDLFGDPIRRIAFASETSESWSKQVVNYEDIQVRFPELTSPNWYELRDVRWSDQVERYGEGSRLSTEKRTESPPRTILPFGRAQVSGYNMDFTVALARKLMEHGTSVAWVPEVFTNALRLNRATDWLLAANRPVVLFGLGANDHVFSPQTEQPEVGIDEFQIRVRWTLDRFRFAGAGLVYLLPDSRTEVRPGLRYTDGSVTKTYRTVLLDLLDEYGFPAVDTDDTAGLRRAQVRNRLMRRLRLAMNREAARVAESTVNDGARARSEPASGAGGETTLAFKSGRTLIADPDTSAAMHMIWVGSSESSGVDEGTSLTGKTLGRYGGRTEFERWVQRRLVGWLESEARAGLPTAMVIGDSVRMRIADATGHAIHGYRNLVGHVNLVHVPHNCGGTKTGVRHIDDWMSPEPDIVLYNAGLHDLARDSRTGGLPPAGTTLNEYQDNLGAIFGRIVESGAKQTLWGLNTPVVEDWHRNSPTTGALRSITRTNEDVCRYNEVSIETASEFGIRVVDLFSPLWVAGVRKTLLADGVHLNHVGGAILGEVVANEIKSAVSSLA